jgi:tellurite resistance protein TerC
LPGHPAAGIYRPVTWLIWVIFLAAVLFLLALDLGVFHRKDRKIGLPAALAWTGFWIALSLLFGVFVYFAYAHNWFGLGLPGRIYPKGLSGKEAATMFFTGYVLEESLSMDNIFVIALIFRFFRIPDKYQHRVLFWGILGALVLRGLMIGLGAWLVVKFSFILYFFGAFLIFTSLRMLWSKEQTRDPNRTWAVRAVRKFFPVTEELHGHHLVIRRDGKWMLTPLMLALVVVEATDLIFAVDSIPAVFAVTRDPFLVFSSNICAILGLRSLYFALAGIMDKFHYLGTALAIILAVVGAKMLLHHWLDDIEGISFYLLGLIGLILTAGILASLLHAQRQQPAEV